MDSEGSAGEVEESLKIVRVRVHINIMVTCRSLAGPGAGQAPLSLRLTERFNIAEKRNPASTLFRRLAILPALNSNTNPLGGTVLRLGRMISTVLSTEEESWKITADLWKARHTISLLWFS